MRDYYPLHSLITNASITLLRRGHAPLILITYVRDISTACIILVLVVLGAAVCFVYPWILLV